MGIFFLTKRKPRRWCDWHLPPPELPLLWCVLNCVPSWVTSEQKCKARRSSTPFCPQRLTTAYAVAYYCQRLLVLHCIYSREKLDLDQLHLVICSRDGCHIFFSINTPPSFLFLLTGLYLRKMVEAIAGSCSSHCLSNSRQLLLLHSLWC